MKHLLLLFAFCFSVENSFAQNAFIFPPTERENVVDTIWGRAVEDPYRWLEDIRSEKTLNWLAMQEKVTEKYGNKMFENLAEHITNYSRIKSTSISKRGKYYFVSRYSDLSEPASLYYKLSPDDDPRFLFNPKSLNESGILEISGISISDDNATLALIISKNGSDWKRIRFLDIQTKELLPDSINFVKYSPVFWSGNGIFYTKYDVQDEAEAFTGLIKIKAVQYHALGTSQEDDIAIYTPQDMKEDFSFEVTPQKNYLILSQLGKQDGKRLRTLSYKSLPLKKDEEFRTFIRSDKRSVDFNVIGEMNDKLLVVSNLNAKNGVVYKCDPKKVNAFEKFLPHYTERLKNAIIVNENKIIALYNGDKRSFGVVNDSNGTKLKTWTIPEGFSFSGLSYSLGDSVLLYSYNSFFNPSAVEKINLNTLEKISLSKTIVPFSFNELTTELVYFYSKDSTLIPMYLTHKKNIKLNSKNPTILYGYGGFGIGIYPFFDVQNIPFLNSGGVLAVPQIRGGGEFPGWHEQGTKLQKQNTFDDFISAAEYLIREKYTSSEKLAAMGGSNGGLLVGACMTQRPDLFKVVVSQAGVLDMLRYHKFNIGYRYEDEYGSADNEISFENLIKYSPVHNVKKGVDYPATLLVASDNDDRVNPFHSFKFLSQLQANGTGSNPYIFYYEENAGHRGSGVFDTRTKTRSFIYSFIYKYLDMQSKIYFED
ncbi:MAG TPA: prolyl oligopeptidase family serine peptidase [Bacteroidia bacterium]|nr:prolyl oligopeptidase family serine peptidase [Bacteroidia bacterium]